MRLEELQRTLSYEHQTQTEGLKRQHDAILKESENHICCQRKALIEAEKHLQNSLEQISRLSIELNLEKKLKTQAELNAAELSKTLEVQASRTKAAVQELLGRAQQT